MRRKNAKIEKIFNSYCAPKIEICGDALSMSWQIISVGDDTYIERKLWCNYSGCVVCHDRQICDTQGSIDWIYAALLDDVLECYEPFKATSKKMRELQLQLNKANYAFMTILAILGRDYEDFIADLFYMWELWRCYPEFNESHYAAMLESGKMTPEARLARRVMSRLEPKQFMISAEQQNGDDIIERATFFSVVAANNLVFWSRDDALLNNGSFSYEMFSDDCDAGYFTVDDDEALARLCEYICQTVDNYDGAVDIEDDGVCELLGVMGYVLADESV